MRRKSGAAMIAGVGISAFVLAGVVATAQAAPGDVPTPAGAGIGSVVIFAPRAGIAPGLPTPQGTILIPTPATGSLVVPVLVPPIPGPGPSITRYVLVIPGPNPAQNTGVALGLQLAVTIGANGAVTVYPIPGP